MKNVITIFVVLVLIAGAVYLIINMDNEEVVYQQDLETPQAVAPESGTSKSKTEVFGSGFNAEMTVSPSVDNVISGIVTVTVTKSPVGTKGVGFAITGGSLGNDLKGTGPNLGFDTAVGDGWTKLVDTTQYPNGLYEISSIAFSDMDSDPLGVATAQVVIEN